jgi:hypothetical protein
MFNFHSFLLPQNNLISRSAFVGWICLCTLGMGVTLWGKSPLYGSPVNIGFVNTSISRQQGHFCEKVSEGACIEHLLQQIPARTDIPGDQGPGITGCC